MMYVIDFFSYQHVQIFLFIIYSVHWFLPLILWASTTESIKFNFFNMFNHNAPHFSMSPLSKELSSLHHHTQSHSGTSSTSSIHKPTASSSTGPAKSLTHPHSSVTTPKSSEKHSTTGQTSTLPYLPNIRNYSQLAYDRRPDSQKYLPNHLTPAQEAEANLAAFTATNRSCYIAPPSNEIIDMNKVRMWIQKFKLHLQSF